MIQHVFKPNDPRVRQIVNCISLVEFTLEDPSGDWIALFPNATSNMAFSLDSGPIPFHFNPGDSLLATACCSTSLLKRMPGLRFITIQFKAYGLFGFSGIPMQEFQNAFLTPDLLFSASEQAELLDRLLSAPVPLSKARVMEQFLLSRRIPERLDERIQFAVSLIKYRRGLSMDDWSREVCLSTRGFRKLFRQQVGVSPAYYKKIIRFNQASQHLVDGPSTSLTHVALDHGYYDQAHFIKDFKAFAGITPSRFMQQKANRSDFYNFNQEDVDSFELVS